MVSITLAVPQDLKEEMDKHPEMNWSEVARQAIKQRVALLNKFKEFTKDSTLTEEEALELGRKVNKAVAAKYRGRR